MNDVEVHGVASVNVTAVDLHGFTPVSGSGDVVPLGEHPQDAGAFAPATSQPVTMVHVTRTAVALSQLLNGYDPNMLESFWFETGVNDTETVPAADGSPFALEWTAAHLAATRPDTLRRLLAENDRDIAQTAENASAASLIRMWRRWLRKLLQQRNDRQVHIPVDAVEAFETFTAEVGVRNPSVISRAALDNGLLTLTASATDPSCYLPMAEHPSVITVDVLSEDRTLRLLARKVNALRPDARWAVLRQRDPFGRGADLTDWNLIRVDAMNDDELLDVAAASGSRWDLASGADCYQTRRTSLPLAETTNCHAHFPPLHATDVDVDPELAYEQIIREAHRNAPDSADVPGVAVFLARTRDLRYEPGNRIPTLKRTPGRLAWQARMLPGGFAHRTFDPVDSRLAFSRLRASRVACTPVNAYQPAGSRS